MPLCRGIGEGRVVPLCRGIGEGAWERGGIVRWRVIPQGREGDNLVPQYRGLTRCPLTFSVYPGDESVSSTRGVWRRMYGNHAGSLSATEGTGDVIP